MQSRQSKVTPIVFIIAGLLSIMLGVVVLSVPALFGPDDTVLRYGFVVMLFLYGSWRCYSGLKRLKPKDENPRI